MNSWKAFNIDREYGALKIALLALITFILTFCFSYVIISLYYSSPHNDQFLSLFIVALVILYPVHKLLHFVALFDFRKNITMEWKFNYRFIPVLSIHLKQYIPKYRYALTLLAPLILLNGLFIFYAIQFPSFAHYFCLLFGIHCGLCVNDFLNLKQFWNSPRHAVIEETHQGFEVLVPPRS